MTLSDPVEAATIRKGDLITYVGAFANYRVLSDPESCPAMPDRVLFDAQQEAGLPPGYRPGDVRDSRLTLGPVVRTRLDGARLVEILECRMCGTYKGIVDRSTCRVCGAVYPGAMLRFEHAIEGLCCDDEDVPMHRVLEWAGARGFQLGRGPVGDTTILDSESAGKLNALLRDAELPPTEAQRFLSGLDPEAFTPQTFEGQCPDLWHQQPHSVDSSCPSCGESETP